MEKEEKTLEERKAYAKPEIIAELELETRAGSTAGGVLPWEDEFLP